LCTSQFVSLNQISNSKERSVWCHWLEQVDQLLVVKGQRFTVRTVLTPTYRDPAVLRHRVPSGSDSLEQGGRRGFPGRRRGATVPRQKAEGQARAMGQHHPGSPPAPVRAWGLPKALLALNRQNVHAWFSPRVPTPTQNNHSSLEKPKKKIPKWNPNQTQTLMASYRRFTH